MSKAIIPFNETPIVPIRLTENGLYAVTDTYTVNRVAQALAATSVFLCNILDKEGGTILDTIAVELLTDGSDGKFTERYERAQLQALLDAYDAKTGPLPAYYELFYSADGTEPDYKIWWKGPILISRSGKSA